MKPRMPVAPSARLVGALLCASLLAVAGLLAQSTLASTKPRASGPAVARSTGAPDLHVSGKGLFTAHGRRVVLHGVSRASAEYMCVQGKGIFDGPTDQASVDAMKSWDVDAVRIPVNEDCWNGAAYVGLKYGGASYRRAVEAYVQLLTSNGIVAILDLHWSDGVYTGQHAHCDSAQARCQKPMPDAANAIPFWISAARAFKNNNAVLFEVFNEPFPDLVAGATEAGSWRCWLRGGTCFGISYQVAGMQSLVTAIRSTGARNVILLGGLHWADDLTGWLTHAPRDPDRNLVAAWHFYPWNPCNTRGCWNRTVAPVIARVPVLADEFGETDCADGFINPLMHWLDVRGTGYLAWAWESSWECTTGPSLITNWSGDPTGYGAGYRAHLRALG
jgi:endoglucanase